MRDVVPRIAVMALAVVLSACSEPTVNARGSDEDRTASITDVKDALPEERRDDFEDAMKSLVFADVDGLAGLADAEGIQRRFKDRIHGKTAEEIIAEAAKAREEKAARAAQREAERDAERQAREAEQKKREREAALAEIEELRNLLDGYRIDVAQQLVVFEASFGTQDGGFMSIGRGMTLGVRNDSKEVVSHITFEGVLVTPGRTVPWVDDDFSYEVPGGLEPGETRELNLSTGFSGEWSSAPRDRADMVFVVRAVELRGAGEKALTGERLGERKEKRLRALIASIDDPETATVLSVLDGHREARQGWIAAASRDAVLREVAGLREKRDGARAAEAQRGKFVVERARFYWQKEFIEQPVIDITVRNGTAKAVSRIHAHGIVSSPGRETSWLSEDFNFRVNGGLEPGESKQTKLSPNQFGAWGKAPKDRADTVLTVTISRLDGDDGERLFPAEWKDAEAARLAALEAVASEQGWK